MTEKTYKGVYLILSLKWSDGRDKLNWWGPDNSGYCYDIDKAGRYTAETVAKNPAYYDNDESTKAVPVDDVYDGKLGPIQRIIASSFHYPTRSYVCHVCDEETVYRIDPRFSIPRCYQCGDSICAICYDAERCSEEVVGGRSSTETTGA